MKPKIRPYLKYLLKQNAVYFVIFVVLMVISAFVIPFFIAQIDKAKTELDKARLETSALETKRRILQTVVNENGDDIDADLALVTGLIPDSEDYFSMIYSLERLSQTTGFIINSYTVNLTKSNSKKLSLTVSGLGDSQSFLELLKNYNFAGGRLITAEKIGIDPLEQNGVSLDLNFYNDKPVLDANEHLDFQGSINELNELRSKVKFSVVSAGDGTQPTQLEQYPTKNNLF